MLDILFNNPTRIQIANFLSSEMIWGMDFWVLVHVASGLILMYIIIKFALDKKFNLNKYWVLFLILFAFEVLEFYWFKTNNRFFAIPETIFEQGFDVVVGFVAAIIWRKYGK